jgi:threonine/homoserine/homoserine lactone efflux protein
MVESSSVRLYSKIQVSVATLLGSPFAGAVLMFLNYRSLEMNKKAAQSLVIGGGATLLLLLVAFLLPENSPNFILPLASIVAIQEWYKRSQEEAFRNHVARGGRKGSWWVSIGVSLSLLVLVVAVTVGVVMVLPESALQ